MSMMMQAIQNKKGRLSEWERDCLGQTERDDLSPRFTVEPLRVPEPHFDNQHILA